MMKHWHKLLWLAALGIGLHSLEASAQSSGNFDAHAYQQFLATHRDMTFDRLRTLHPTAPFRDKINLTLNQVAYLDTIIQLYGLTSDEQALLKEHGFVVSERLRRDAFGGAYLEIFNHDLPVFVSTDALLHALHRSYDAILQDTETGILISRLERALALMYAGWPSLANQYAAQPAMQPMLQDLDLYLTLALRLLGTNTAPHVAANQTALAELTNLITAEQPANYNLFAATPRLIDFSQFRPRGHYTNDEALRKYFQCMIWLGRTELMLTKPQVQGGPEPTDADIQRQIIASYLLLELAKSSGALVSLHEMDGIIRFLVGESDNVTLANLQLLAEEIGMSAASELLDPARLQAWQAALANKAFALQRINSQILLSDPMSPEQIQPPSAFLLLGQRFVIDSYVMANVVYDRILFEGRKVTRNLPSSLDVLFALGNDASAVLLKDELEKYPYASNLAALRYLVDSYEEDFWNSALYNVWLQSIRTLNPPQALAPLPSFMQTGAYWQQKMNTQLSAWAQLRHDNLLYAKQSYTGGYTCLFPHSFVEPFPVFYRTLQNFAAAAQAQFGALAFADESTKAGILKYFAKMAGVMDTLATVADKQLRRAALDSSEAAFLQGMLYDSGVCAVEYNGWFPKLFYRGAEQCNEKDLVIADVHTQPTDESGNLVGHVMHAGTGPLDLAIIIAEVENGKQRAYIGPVMSYYEHVTVNFKRLTDEEWQELYAQPSSVRPAWVNVYLADANGNRRGPGPQLVTGVDEAPSQEFQPTTHLLQQNHPNPFNAGTTIRFEIPFALANRSARLTIYNIRGEVVRELLQQALPAGNYFVRWDGKNAAAREASSGIYLYQLQVGQVKEVRKLSLLK